MQVGFRSFQAQEKGNKINNIVAWDKLRTLIAIGAEARNEQAGRHFVLIRCYLSHLLLPNISRIKLRKKIVALFFGPEFLLNSIQ